MLGRARRRRGLLLRRRCCLCCCGFLFGLDSGLLRRRPHRLQKGLLVEQIRDHGPVLRIGYGLVQSDPQLLAELRVDPDVGHRGGPDDDLAVIVALAFLGVLPGFEFGHPGLNLLGLFFLFG